MIYKLWLSEQCGGHLLRKRIKEKDLKIVGTKTCFENIIKWIKANGNPQNHKDWREFKASYL